MMSFGLGSIGKWKRVGTKRVSLCQLHQVQYRGHTGDTPLVWSDVTSSAATFKGREVKDVSAYSSRTLEGP